MNLVSGVVAHSELNEVWSAPPPHVVKINVDAALKDSVATLAAVARDSSGIITNCWTKKYPTSDPCIAEAMARDSSGIITNWWTKRHPTSYPCITEAMALLWALELAQANCFSNVVVEGDAKVCVDAINVGNDETSWRILPIITNAKNMISIFCSCSFNWVRRNANFVTYILAKVASSQPICLSCNSTNLSPSIHKAWIRDLLALSS